MSKLTPAARGRIYVLITALLPILVAYGVLADTEAGLWLALAAAFLGSGGTALAARHIPDADDYAGRHRKAAE